MSQNHSQQSTLLTDNPVVGLLINPNSRRCKKHLNEITAIANKCETVYPFITNSVADISAALEEMATLSIDILAICGGDGTVAHVLTELYNIQLFESKPVIAILPGGTANMTAGDTGFTINVVSALRWLCDFSQSPSQKDFNKPPFQHRPILRIQPGTDKEPLYGFFFGAGAIVNGIEYTNENIHSKGLKHELSLGMGLVRSIWGIVNQDPRFIKATNIAISADDQPPGEPAPMVLILISTLERLFLNIHPYWGDEPDKPLHKTVIHFPAKRFMLNLLSILRGKPNKHTREDTAYQSQKVDSAGLYFDGPFTLDGEIYHAKPESGPVEISSGGNLVFLRANK